jgi:cobalt-zinc-cadmium efflux system outer membrane protein
MPVSRRWFRAVSGSLVPLLAGCATVDPQPDYQRADEYIQRATAHEEAHPREDAEALHQHVGALLEDGLTVEEAAEIALLNNPELRAAWMRIGIAKADLIQAGLLSNPSLAMAFRLPAGGGLSAIDLDIAQNIADLWQIPPRKRAGERVLERTILEIAHQATALAAEAKGDYFVALGAEERLKIARENLEVTRTTLELTRFRQQAGAGSTLDLNLARGVVLEAQLAVDRARLATAEARRELATTLGLMIDADELVLAASLPSPPQYELASESLKEMALTERLDFRALSAAVRAADERLVLEYRRVFPSLEVGLSLEREARKAQGGRNILADTARASIANGQLTAPEIEPRSARDSGQEVTLGPSFALELPVFDQNQARIARARYEREQAVRRLERLERMITQEVFSAIDQAETAWKIARFYHDEVLPQAKQNLAMSQESYRVGKASILSVLDAERTYLAARDGYAGALEEAAAAVPRLERTIGLPVEAIVRAGVTRPPKNPPTQPTTAPAPYRHLPENGDQEDE